MIGYLDLLLRLAIWFLLTADVSAPNILIGLAVALLLPRSMTRPAVLKDWLRVLGEILVAIPQAFIEAIEIMVRPHNREDIALERVKPMRTDSLIFLDIFLITFTPKTIVVKYHKDGWYEVHRVRPRKRRSRRVRSGPNDPNYIESDRSGPERSEPVLPESQALGPGHSQELTLDPASENIPENANGGTNNSAPYPPISDAHQRRQNP